MNRVVLALFGPLFPVLACVFANAQTFTTLNDPLHPLGGTSAQGIDGNNIVGYYSDSSGRNHGFLYNGSTYMTLDDPFANTIPGQGTEAYGISGNNIVGQYWDSSGRMSHGFLYNISTSAYTTFDHPLGVLGNCACGISGSNVVGYYNVATTGSPNGYVYDGSTFTTLDDPLPRLLGTVAYGISGNNIVGEYTDAGNIDRGFIYNGSTFTTLDDPLGVKATHADGISGNIIVGDYEDSSRLFHGFVYNGSTFTTLDDPLSVNGTWAYGISGNNIVGTYQDLYGNHGFIVTIPEPSTFALLTVGAIALFGYRFRRRFTFAHIPHRR